MKEVKENWKDVKGYEGVYMVSDLGNVKSLNRKDNINRLVKERILKANLNSRGYLAVSLYKNGKQKLFRVHQLVCIAFLNHTPSGYKIVVDHKNAIKTDNRLSNLQLITARLNSSKDKKNCSSKYTGVSWAKHVKKWRSAIRINGKSKYLGMFKTEIEAHERYQLELTKL